LPLKHLKREYSTSFKILMQRRMLVCFVAGARPAIGRRSVGVPHGSVRAFHHQQQQQQHSCRTLLVVPSSSSSRSARGGSVSTSPSSASPSPSPEPISRHATAGRSLSTHRPLGVTRTALTGGATEDHTGKLSRTCLQRHHCDQRQLTPAGQTPRPDEMHEQETFV